jgi:hypothetical protein
MDTLEYSEHLMRIGKGLMRIAEHAEAAGDGDLEGAERDSAIELARTKLADYEDVMARLAHSSVLRDQFVRKFQFHIELIRESLAKVDAG